MFGFGSSCVKTFTEPSKLRLACRSGEFAGQTSGQASGFAQANLCILPKEYAYDFLLYCTRNPKPCPLLHVLDEGEFTFGIWGKKIDIRTDLPRYRIFKDGELLKEVTSLNRTNEKYQSNTIEYPDDEYADYNDANSPMKLFNTQGKQIHKLSSGYYPEYTNQFFEQLLLSEYVWMTRPKKENPASDETIPVLVKTSNMTFKTSVNDRLIEYTIDFEEAFDLINNIR